MNRRHFLAAAASVPLLRAGKRSASQARIGISSWSFHNLFTATRDTDAPKPSAPLAALDFPDMIASRYDVHELEIVAPHFESTGMTYLAKLKARLAEARSRIVNIPVDIPDLEQGGGLSDKDPMVRDRAIAACMKWIDVAHEVGAASVRCDPGKMDPADPGPTVTSYHKLGAYAASRGLKVLIENHGGVGSEHPEELVRIFRLAGTGVGALPDFGNFPDEATRKRGLPLLLPYASTVAHAKGFEFDGAGNEKRFDFARCVAQARAAGFHGVYSIEFEGPGDPYDGVGKVVAELQRLA